GDIPTAPTLAATEAEQRFQLTFAALVRILGEGRPVVLFLDDLQWADSATLRLMEYLAGDPGDLHLLLIAAYRVAEMAAEGPTARALATLTGAALPVFTIDLGPLSLDEVTALCADILGATQERAAPLAAYAHKKTEGNAFFVQQFLRSLVADGHLAFDLSDSAWHWDMADVARLGTTANADLVTKAIRGLPARTRHALTVAACFSHHVELSLLAQLLGQSVDDTAADLWAAIDADLLIPAAITPAGSVAYQFLHDRVHQAAQSLLSEDEKQHIHLEIGSQLSAGTSPESLEERLFDAVDQLNLGAAVITADTHRLKIAKLNLRAGEKARSQAAYGPALGYLSRGIELTRKIDPALVPHALVFRLFRHATECAFLSGDVERAEKLAQAALDIAESTLEKLEIFNIHITAFASRGEHAEALRLGHVGFALFDDALPPAPTPPQLLEIFAAMRAKLANRPPQALLGQPRMVDRTILAQMELLANLLSPAFVSDQMLFAALVSRMVTLSLDHGSSVYSSFAYAAYGMLTCAFEKAYAQGHAWGQLGVALARRFGDPVQECRAIHSFTCFLSHWRAPLASTLPVVRTGIVRGIESGELQFGTLCQSTLVVTLYHMGVELSQLINELDVSLPLARRTHNKAACEYQLAYRQAARCLQGNTRDLATFDDDGFSEAGHLEATADNPVALALYLVLRLEASYLAGDLETARAMADRAAPVVVTIGVLFPIAEYHLYSALAFAGEAKTSTAARDRVATHVAALAPFAETCPQNFAAKHRLAAAALAIVDGDPDGAAALYDDAIDAAHDARFVKDEALACELAARLWRHRGRERIARMYLGESLAAYRRWGALAKVAALEEQIPQPVAAELSAWRPPRIAVDARGRAFDLLGLLRAAGTISSEVAIDRLVANLLEVCFELAGATRGGLIVAEKDELLVLALGATTEPVTVARTPLEACRDLPAEVIRLAWEAGTQVVAADASRDRRLAGDPYFAREKIRSALIMPIRRQAAAMGVLYLENRLMADVFSSERVQVLRLLSSQIAISLENSLLFEKLRFESGENARLYAEAQESIRLRNEFLSIASHELKTPITSIQLVVQGLLSSLSSSPQTFPQVSRIAERQVLRLSSLVDELLTVSRIQEGRLHLSLEEVDLVSLTHEVVERFAFQSAQARCEVVIRNDPAVIGHWDRSRLDQVLTNLLSNAIKFGPGKPIDIEVRRHHGHAQLTITDHGIGIPAERIPHIFKRFERAVPASRYGGLGLGLYIAYQIAQALGATIDVTSEIGAGATFTLTLPLAAELRAGEDGVGRGL
ncbi:MAG TPA: ATP-binding protein, partial [Kofleriaceae bacterium]|nr:ATP-binding protein [Kofleriaceae bacterium]